MARKPRPAGALPSREDVVAFIRGATGKVGKREIAREFDVSADDRPALKDMLRELEADGTLERSGRRTLTASGQLPAVFVGEVVSDEDDEILARPVKWTVDTPPPVIEIRQGARRPALGVGDRGLLRVVGSEGVRVIVNVLRRFETQAPGLLVGVYDIGRDGPRITSSETRGIAQFAVPPGQDGGAAPGELVEAEILPGRRGRLPQAKVKGLLGGMDRPGALSLIAIRTYDLPSVFPEAALAEAELAKVPPLGKRTDLRDLPLVTIDGEDARDFDDAVYAEADGTGWRVIVAIADVAHYVRRGDPVDREAQKRGNSVYLPDRVLPMIPEALSNGVCSLKPGEPRACLAFDMRMDAGGTVTGHTLVRGLMRSAARLTYTQVQAAMDGQFDDITGPLADPVLAPLIGAFRALSEARAARGVLELSLTEKKVVLDEAGKPVDISVRHQNDSNRLIEEFMIAANVAAAATLEAAGAPCMYRVHDVPSPEKVEQLGETLKELGLPFAKGQVLRPSVFNKILAKVRNTPEEELVNTLILRSQAMAEYSPRNIGHFGLSLARYAHFTSPIRRYADLLVHRSLIAAQKLGPDGEDLTTAFARFLDVAPKISAAERRAQAAERDTVDRYMALFLADRVGATVEGRVRGCSKAGLFVALDGTDADAFIPISDLPRDYYIYDHDRAALTGERSGRQFRLGDRLTVRIRETNPLTGGILLDLIAGGTKVAAPGGGRRKHGGRRNARAPRRRRR